MLTERNFISDLNKILTREYLTSTLSKFAWDTKLGGSVVLLEHRKAFSKGHEQAGSVG